jgi:hypothetical protein
MKHGLEDKALILDFVSPEVSEQSYLKTIRDGFLTSLIRVSSVSIRGQKSHSVFALVIP